MKSEMRIWQRMKRWLKFLADVPAGVMGLPGSRTTGSWRNGSSGRGKLEVFGKYPEFIDTDPRLRRTDGYQISADFMEIRHECMLDSSYVKGRKILDMGCCVGATGAWVLHHGATFYHGIEYDAELANLSRANLEKYFSHDRWKVDTTSVEDFLKSNKERYDIIIASGIIYSFFDPIPILNGMAGIADSITIESVNPFRARDSEPRNVLSAIRGDRALWRSFMEDTPFMVLKIQPMMRGVEAIRYRATVPGQGYLKGYMDIVGFKHVEAVHDTLESRLPERYNPSARFALRFDKVSGRQQSQGFLAAMNNAE
ncbi:MAG: class I SAM-dependent methyltransferase [bacterium]